VETTMTVAASVCMQRRGHTLYITTWFSTPREVHALPPPWNQTWRSSPHIIASYSTHLVPFACKHTFGLCTYSLERTPRCEGVGVRASARAQSIHLLVLHREAPTTCVANRSALLLHPPHLAYAHTET
jgi:hypothetical protein